ncbi:hydrophobic surface binding protein A-domain-containing protein [Mycotypha africana]|uniref:hydrophobic surface binding protein A-domain-containing protein n=1 Tax=Mycotypha africana TaxID=64632 RepID=UPI0023004B48|nr:hydrophobic surface binding protein A-domain-containing protein [Mycotypha africana]KAI8975157.1 hydrophobic surface binding protein A-domain-containing protein [Mycotypha africana]
MRSFTFVALAALALGANAATVNKRAISTPVQTCINDIIAVSNQLDIVTADVNAFTSSAGYSGAIAIHTKEQVLETKLKQAGTDCCAVSGTVTDEEAQAVLAVVSDLVPDVTAALASIVSKKSQFDAILLATTLVKNDIKNLDSQTNTLDTCLLAKTPSAYKTQANGLVTQISNAFASAKSAYGI